MSWANLVFNWHIIIFLILHLRWHSSEEEEGRTLSQNSVHSSFTSPYLQALLIELCDLCWSFIFFFICLPILKKSLPFTYLLSHFSVFQDDAMENLSMQSPRSKFIDLQWWISALKFYWLIMVYLVRESHIKLKTAHGHSFCKALNSWRRRTLIFFLSIFIICL